MLRSILFYPGVILSLIISPIALIRIKYLEIRGKDKERRRSGKDNCLHIDMRCRRDDYGIFADTGTGKTIMGLELAKHYEKTLILCPLSVIEFFCFLNNYEVYDHYNF